MAQLHSLLSKKPLPKIHVLSDVHLESGPYEPPVTLDCDIVVAAGDIGPLELAVPWLTKLGVPVVYVLGNHEYYGQKFDQAASEAKRLAKNTNVHVLDCDEITLQGVRFIGGTLWSSFGDWHPTLVTTALRRMNDYRQVEIGNFLNSAQKKRTFKKLCKAANLDVVIDNLTYLHPAAVYMKHQSTVKWLKTSLSKKTGIPTVVVTHHAPAYDCLKIKNIEDDLLTPEKWDNYSRNEKLVYVSAYASNLNKLLRQYRNNINLWVHGHIHYAQDILVQGVRIFANPRGRYIAPLTEQMAKGYALLGVPLTTADIEASQELARLNPYRGDGKFFNANAIIQLEHGNTDPLRIALSIPMAIAQKKLNEAQTFLSEVSRGRATQKLAARRCVARAKEEFVKQLEDIDNFLQKNVFFWGIQMLQSLPNSPKWPYLSLDEDAQTKSDFSECINDMREWMSFLTELTKSIDNQLYRWLQKTIEILTWLEAQGIPAVAIRPPTTIVRFIGISDIVINLCNNYDESTVMRLNLAVDKLINKKMPRLWHIVLNTTEDYPKSDILTGLKADKSQELTLRTLKKQLAENF